MAGVIDERGVQWERCSCCAKWVRLDNLGYEQPTEQHEHGRDLCVQCVDAGIKNGSIEFDNIDPAAAWVVYEAESA